MDDMYSVRTQVRTAPPHYVGPRPREHLDLLDALSREYERLGLCGRTDTQVRQPKRRKRVNRRGRPRRRARRVYAPDGREWPSVHDAAVELGALPENVFRALRMHWRVRGVLLAYTPFPLAGVA